MYTPIPMTMKAARKRLPGICRKIRREACFRRVAEQSGDGPEK